jgi:cytochrome bd-type quinol oxidase subunit 2
MLKNVKLTIVTMVMSLGLLSFSLLPATVSAQSSIADKVCTGVLSTSGEEGSDISSCEEDGENNFTTIITRVINIFSVLIGAISVIMIIIGGFRYIISGGDQNNVTAAKNTIMYAIIGLVVVLFSQVIVRFILSNAVTKN